MALAHCVTEPVPKPVQLLRFAQRAVVMVRSLEMPVDLPSLNLAQPVRGVGYSLMTLAIGATVRVAAKTVEVFKPASLRESRMEPRSGSRAKVALVNVVVPVVTYWSRYLLSRIRYLNAKATT